MPYALIIFGAILLTASVRNTQADLFRLLKGEFTGSHNFVYWLLSILIIGAIGYVDKLKPISSAFMVLVVMVLFLSNRGFFNQFQSQIQSTGIGSLSNNIPAIPAIPNIGSLPNFGGIGGLTIPQLPDILSTFAF